MENNLQYPLKRKNPQYTKAVMDDEAFFGNVMDLNQPGMESIQAAVKSKDYEKAWAEYLAFFGKSPKRRCHLGMDDVSRLSKHVRDHYQREEIDPIIRFANRLVEKEIPLGGEWTAEAARSVRLEGKPYDWNAWLFDSSQYQMILTRFEWLAHLCHAYCITGDKKYAVIFNDLISDFLDENPPPRDGAFKDEHCTWDILSAGCRMFYWPEAFITFFESPEFTMDTKIGMVKSFYEHGVYLRHYHTRHGNHACMELRGLAAVAAMFPEFAVSGEWLAYSLQEFPSYIWQNVYEDGVQFEASPAYHAVVMRDAYEMLNMLKWMEVPDEMGIGARLEKMFEVFMHLLTPCSTLPRFGDTDLLSEKIQKDIMAIGTILFKRSDFKYLSGNTFPIHQIWRYGIENVHIFKEIQAAAPNTCATYYPVGGYMISRENWERDAKYMVMRAGVGINGHTHADALSIIAYAYGKELVVDSGIGLYEWIPERKYLVSTKAHNTVTVDGQDQHVRNLHWAPPPSAPCKIWDFRSEERFDFFFASHYGYTRYEDPVIHTRKVLFVKNRYWVIIDLLHAEDMHQHDLYFHLPSGDAAANSDMSEIRTLAEEANILIAHPEQKDIRTSMETGILYSNKQYDTKPVVKYSQNKAGDACFTTVLVPYGDRKPEVKVRYMNAFADGEALEQHQATAIEISFDGMKDFICIHHGSVQVEGYLDHTGNRINDALIKKPTGCVEFVFKDTVFHDDIVLISADRADEGGDTNG
ncbi:MAG: hypothetical protein K0R57_1139 [Paenibacillaceae bacterium]|jgi:hypothetical protein|nr:hypothetical protein [Paenibacillaceae bacterium]